MLLQSNCVYDQLQRDVRVVGFKSQLMVCLQEIHPYCPEEQNWTTTEVQKSIENWNFEVNQNVFLSWFHVPTQEPLSQIDPQIDIQLFPYFDRPGSLRGIMKSLSNKELFRGELINGTLQGKISAQIAKLPGNVKLKVTKKFNLGGLATLLGASQQKDIQKQNFLFNSNLCYFAIFYRNTN